MLKERSQKTKTALSFFYLLFPCFPVFFFFFGCSHFGAAFLTEAIALVLHIPSVEHLPAILAPVIAHDFAFCIRVIFQGFYWFYIIPLRQGLTSD
jgi:hypothetical protein